MDDNWENNDGPDPHYKTICRLWFFFVRIALFQSLVHDLLVTEITGLADMYRLE